MREAFGENQLYLIFETKRLKNVLLFVLLAVVRFKRRIIMNNLIKTVVLGVALCLGGCSHLSPTERAELGKITTADSLGIQLRDSKTKVENILKSKGNLVTTIETSAIFNPNSGQAWSNIDATEDTVESYALRTDLGTIDMTFVFDKNQKLAICIFVYPTDLSKKLTKLEELKRSRILYLGIEREKKIGKFGIECICERRNGIFYSIYQMPRKTMSILETKERDCRKKPLRSKNKQINR